MKSFVGAKVALLYDGQIITIQRDNKPGLRFAGMWDLPGGGRENNETPVDTAKREVFEELRIILNGEDYIYEKEYPSMTEENSIAYFLAVRVTGRQIEDIVFGDEGQGWKLTTIADLIKDENAVPFLRTRLEDLVAANITTA